MNEVIRVLENRKSVRGYKPELIPEADLNQIAEAGLHAPSGMNRQSAKLVVITDPSIMKQLSEMNCRIMGGEKDPFYGAQEMILVLADKTAPTYVYDGALVMGNLLNAAYALGYGACWIHRAKEEFESEEGKELLKKWGIEGEWEGIGHCIIGYPVDPIPAPVPIKEGRIIRV
ncbi:nitroreductase family protein [Erysipelotrichaceae bacterium Oil+RF-744-GAM-WT-6]|jgi:nitroreductase|uniref:Nitroreductase family protein n=1 Tax=Stecheria intestinalis TaxID=2606630 RepID=A0A7X2TGB8_9FIRM|nr:MULTISPECIES: nitroreductase family protein [Erysipelotrichaceae]MCI2154221.1 nitroreductase family protein [Solobacterium sp.]MDY3233909.1 nitroreductase family protein [Erysipelotrichaceae bacterium]MDD5881333.1 nitroreductase family protein [Stecheria intestinalis]MDD6367493.1 nitroreductase family protein [Stecheria intestinalis]MSS58563.1 nitroreductase family protein [Stecheria intestinalis]